MKARYLVFMILVVIIILSLFFIFNYQPEVNNQDNILLHIVSAKEFVYNLSEDYNFTTNTYILDFLPFKEGDRVVVQDIIDYIYYVSDEDYTAIEFDIESENFAGENISSFEFDILGDITNTYRVDDEIKITFTIKHVTFSDDEINYDLEVYKEAWNQDDFLRSYTQVLPQNTISLIT
jgi:hypothetical protein